MQRKYFDASDFGGQIIQHCGDALEVIPSLDLQFDLVYIDAEKTEYPGYFEAVLKKTRPGSVILSDNVLWSGKVVEPLAKNDKATEILLEYNKKLKEDPRVRSALLPIRDGLTLSLVK
jgi:predicted O-methyltransferase YrrM